MQRYLDEISQRHAESSTQLTYIIEWLFKDQTIMPNGTKKDEVMHMTKFKQIKFLEGLVSERSSLMLGNTRVGFAEIVDFVSEVDKDGFRTADDFEFVDCDDPSVKPIIRILPQYVLGAMANWQEDAHMRGEDYELEVRHFFNANNPCTYIDEGPESSEQKYNHQYLPDLIKVAAEYGCSIISSDSPVAKEFYLRLTNKDIERFKLATNPFVAFANSLTNA